MMDDDDDDDDQNDDDYKCLRDFISIHQLPMLQLPGFYCTAFINRIHRSTPGLTVTNKKLFWIRAT